ncbi:Hydroxylysine kinase [Trichoplax sp. H2]|nr:Hydroxylysine kinase [Trichoplax sp. H2]|eukprot:RDD42497.1 Hydroxylysine kinase [Trichoplax sp. H2]
MEENICRKLFPIQHRPPALSKVALQGVLKDLLGTDIGISSVYEFCSFCDRNYHIHIDHDKFKHYLESKDLQLQDDQFKQNQQKPSFVLKILNPCYLEYYELTLARLKLLQYLHNCGIRCPKILPLHNGNIMKTVRLSDEKVKNQAESMELIAYILIYIEGQTIAKIHSNFDLCYRLGRFAAEIDIKLQAYSDETIKQANNIWSLQNFPACKYYLKYCSDEKRGFLENIFNQICRTYFNKHVKNLRTAIIHADFNHGNIIVKYNNETNNYDINGIIDFGLVNYSYVVFELAVLMAYTLLTVPHDRIRALGHLISGFHSVFPLTEVEYKSIYTLIILRLVQTSILTKYSSNLQPDNEFTMDSYEEKLEILKFLLSIPERDVYAVWDKIVGFSVGEDVYNYLESENIQI